jgi:hypothetical protein
MKPMRNRPFSVAALLASFVLGTGAEARAAAIRIDGPVAIDDSVNTGGIPGGNVNGKADPGETVKLGIRVKNLGFSPLTQLTATLSASFAGVPVATASSTYPDLGPAGSSGDSALNTTPFPVSVSQGYPAGARISLELTIRSGGNLVDHLWSSLLVGEFLGGIHEDLGPVGDAGSLFAAGFQSPLLLRRGDGFALLYCELGGNLFSEEVRYQPLGPFGEPGPIASAAQGCLFGASQGPNGYGLVYADPESLRLYFREINQTSPVALQFQGQPLAMTQGNLSLTLDPGPPQFAFTYRDGYGLHLVRLDGNGNVLSPITDLSSGGLSNVPFAQVQWRPDGYVVVWSAIGQSNLGLFYARVSPADGTIEGGQSELVLRDPNAPGQAQDLAVALSTDPNDPNDSNLGVFWTDTRNAAVPNCFTSPTNQQCLGQVYFRSILADGSLGAEVRVTDTQANAVKTSAVWDPAAQRYEAAWLDLRNSASGFCGADCQTALFRQMLRSDGSLVDAAGQSCQGPCNEQVWSNVTLDASGSVLGRSDRATGYLMPVVGADQVHLNLGIRTPIHPELWVKEDPAQTRLINEQLMTESGAIGRRPGQLVAVWDEAGFPVHPKLKARSIQGQSLGEATQLLPAPSCGTDPNVPPCDLYPLSPSVPIPFAGGSVTAFLEQVSDPNTQLVTAPRIHVLGFEADGRLLFVRKVADGVNWGNSQVAVLGDRIGVVYVGDAGGVNAPSSGVEPPPGNPDSVRFRVFDTAGNPVSQEEIIASSNAGSPAIATLPDRFVIGWIDGLFLGGGMAHLKFRDSAGNPLGSDTPIDVGADIGSISVAAADDRIAVAYGLARQNSAFFEVFDETGDPIVPPEQEPLISGELEFTGHEFLSGGLRIRPDGSLVDPGGILIDVSGELNRLTGQFDGFRFAYGLTVMDALGRQNLVLETFRPPSEGYASVLYNTAPTVTANAQNPGQPYQAPLGGGLTLRASATSGANGMIDPGDQQLGYAWDLNGDGITDFSGAQVTLTAVQLAQFGIDTAGTFTIHLTVTDSQGASTAAAVQLHLLDVTAPQVRVVAPNGGESWPVGSSQVISWEAIDDVGVDHFDLYYATDYSSSRAASWQLIATVPGSKSAYTWNAVPNVLSATARIRVVAVDGGNNRAEDISDKNLYFILASTAAVKTLILVPLARLDQHYPGSSGALLSKLEELASRDSVSGVVLPLENVPAVDAALQAWDTAHAANPATSQPAALAAAKAIHDYLWAPGTGQASAVFTQARYLVLVGEDQALPFYRVKDSTGVLPESAYSELSATSTVGAALAASAGAAGGYFLSDDYYGAAEPEATQVGSTELWLPSLAVGRLVQTPAEIEGQINRFIAQNGEVRATRALTTGYDFLIDGAQDITAALAVPGVTVDSSLVGQRWMPADLKCRLLGQAGCSARPALLSINGHASHHQLGSAQGALEAMSLASSGQPLAGAVLWGMGCHSGLVVPETEAQALDIPQALNRLGVVAQVGQTGFGWGFRQGVGLSEALMREFSERLVSAPFVAVGDALTEAKTAYFLSALRYDVFDEKVLQEAELYGLPMYRVVTGQSGIARSEPHFAAAEPDGRNLRGGVTTLKSTRAVPGGITALELNFDFGPDTLRRVDTADGSFYQLNGLTTSEIGNPLEPMFLYDSTLSGTQFRGVLFTGGSYTEQNGFNPTLGVPQSSNEDHGEGPLPNNSMWLPSIGRHGRRHHGRAMSPDADGESRLVVSVGHYLGAGRHRLFDAMSFDAYYSNSSDTTPPVITDPGPNAVLHVKTDKGLHFGVTAEDDMQLYRVMVTYSDEQGHWSSLDLAPEAPGSTRWVGDLDNVSHARYLVQAVDTAGNSSYLGHPNQDLDGAGQAWGTQTFGPRLFSTEPGVPVPAGGFSMPVLLVCFLITPLRSGSHRSRQSKNRDPQSDI